MASTRGANRGSAAKISSRPSTRNGQPAAPLAARISIVSGMVQVSWRLVSALVPVLVTRISYEVSLPTSTGSSVSTSSMSRAGKPSMRVDISPWPRRPRAAVTVARCLNSPGLMANSSRVTSLSWPGSRSPMNQITDRVTKSCRPLLLAFMNLKPEGTASVKVTCCALALPGLMTRRSR